MTTTTAFTTIEAKWQARTVPTADGHLDWTGSPWLRWNGQLHKPARIAFTIATGRQPTGYVLPDCGHRGCVKPGHVLDQPGRRHLRQQMRALHGIHPQPDTCTHGHDQTIHGRYTTHHKAYCNACLNRETT